MNERRGGVLLHPTSLPGPHGSGDFGPAARHFIDWLAVAGQSLWQVLPLTVPGPGNSPYMSPSAFAGNPLLIDLGALHEAGWLSAEDVAPLPDADPRRVDFARVTPFRVERLHRAARRFFAAGEATPAFADYRAYCTEQAEWLDDDALFMALRERHGGELAAWPISLRRRDAEALQDFQRVAASAIAEWKFIQWCFDRQWAAVRTYARQRGIAIVGDLPIFVADHGVDLWARPELFDLDASGRPRVVAGVPPDYFSATGQHWGNPLYDWPAHARDGYRWWRARLRRVLDHCDRVRIDHFRGFESYWAIPAGETTALKGRWLPGPGAAFFAALRDEIDIGALLAEDLGIITPAVRALRRELDLPGMAILQFAFDGKTRNPYLPHNLRPDCAVYTGTHDNDTVRGWWDGLDDTTRRRVADYLGQAVDTLAAEPHWALIRAAAAAVAADCLLPMQDVLGLGGEARLNRPGEATGCWEWRFHWEQVGPRPAERLAELTRLYGRSGADANDEEAGASLPSPGVQST